MATQYTAGLTTGQVLTAATMNSIGATWENWSPTVTSSGGALVSVTTNSARYSQVNKIITCVFDITINSVGSGSGSLLITMPVASVATANGQSMGTYRERSVTGDQGFCNRSGTTVCFLQRYDQGAILNSGRSFAGIFTYEAA
tara:strand:- start:1761 stop:2189 length:429 start_codon:yes stop_codon:yes gene_type:complete